MTLLLVIFSFLGGLLIWQAINSPIKTEVSIRPRRGKQSPDWPELVDDLHSAIRAGLSLPQAFGQLHQNAPESLKPAFEESLSRYRVTNNFRTALRAFADEANDPAADNFAAALILASELGGTDLGVVLRALSESLRAEQSLTQELVARQSWTVNGARLAVAAPWVIVLLLSFRSESRTVYLSSGGLRLLELCLGISVLAYLLMMRIGRLPKPVRLVVGQ